MAPYAVHLVKRTLWHGVQEEFENVYHYNTGPAPDNAGWAALIDAIVNAEKPLYGTDVNFVRARVHGPTDAGEDADQMRYAADLVGAGTSTAGQTIPPELAVIVKWDLGRSARGYKQILKKFIHGGTIEGSGVTTGHAFGRSAMGAAQMAKYITYGNTVKSIMVGPTNNLLCNPAGKNFPSAQEPTVAPYVYTRQFKRGRKEKRAA